MIKRLEAQGGKKYKLLSITGIQSEKILKKKKKNACKKKCLLKLICFTVTGPIKKKKKRTIPSWWAQTDNEKEFSCASVIKEKYKK